MKKTLVILAASLLISSFASAEEETMFIEWDASFNGLVVDRTVSMSQLNKEITAEIKLQQEHYGQEDSNCIEMLTVKDSVINVDAVDFAPVLGFSFVGDCGLNFNVLMTVTEPETGFTLGDMWMPSGQNSLTINLGANVVTGITWDHETGGDTFTHDLLICSYFAVDPTVDYDGNVLERGNVILTIGGLAEGAKVGDFTNAGYVSSIDELEEGEIGLATVPYTTDAWTEDGEPWDGYKLMLVARSAALPVITEDDFAPEPTTGTLSLLGLAGLCARRRRK